MTWWHCSTGALEPSDAEPGVEFQIFDMEDQVTEIGRGIHKDPPKNEQDSSNYWCPTDL